MALSFRPVSGLSETKLPIWTRITTVMPFRTRTSNQVWWSWFTNKIHEWWAESCTKSLEKRTYSAQPCSQQSLVMMSGFLPSPPISTCPPVSSAYQHSNVTINCKLCSYFIQSIPTIKTQCNLSSQHCNVMSTPTDNLMLKTFVNRNTSVYFTKIFVALELSSLTQDHHFLPLFLTTLLSLLKLGFLLIYLAPN